MAGHMMQHGLNSAADHSPGTNGTLMGTESSALAEKAFGTGATADLIAQRDGSGDLAVPATPGGSGMATSQAYVDSQVAGARDAKDSARVATDAALPAVTAAGSKVGKTLTADAVGVLTVDGVATVLGDRILVKNQVTGADNGLYEVTTEGTGGVAFVLTRATDADDDAEVSAGLYVWADEGTANGDKGFLLTTNDPITVDTTTLTFARVSGLGQITAGAALTKTGDTLDWIPDDATLEVNADQARIKALGVGTAEIAALAVTTAKIAALAVTSAELGTNAVTNAKIGDNAVDTAEINAGAVTLAKLADQKTKIALAGAAPVTGDFSTLTADGQWAFAVGTGNKGFLLAELNAGGLKHFSIELGEIT